MRFYQIDISNADGTPYVFPSGLKSPLTSFVNGATNPGALDIQIDVPITAFDAPIGKAYVRIWGISLQDIGQAADLNGKFISMRAGMKPGLPLANPSQAGQIFNGSIQFAFGNWHGVNQTIDLILNAIQQGSSGGSGKTVFYWPAHTPMSQALATMFSAAFPTMKQSINVASNLILPTTELHYADTLEEMAGYIRELSLSILGGASSYAGVSISIINGVITAQDATPPASSASQQGTTAQPKQILFTDLIEQPTWLGPVELSVALVMRGDLKIGQYVKMPTGLPNLAATETATPGAQFRQKSVFQGTFFINSIRHVGRFRQADGLSWCTVINLLLQTYTQDVTGKPNPAPESDFVAV